MVTECYLLSNKKTDTFVDFFHKEKDCHLWVTEVKSEAINEKH